MQVFCSQQEAFARLIGGKLNLGRLRGHGVYVGHIGEQQGGIGGLCIGKGIAVPGKQKILQCTVQIDSFICNVDAGRQGMFYVAGNNLPCVLSLFDIAVLCRFPHIVRKEKAVNQHGKRGGDDQGGQQLITNALKRLFHMDILSGWIFLPLIIVKKAEVVWRLFQMVKIIPLFVKIVGVERMEDLVI